MKKSEKFTYWMEAETSYALSKFKPAEQYAYFEQGVARGDFSFQSSSMSYLRRARVFSEYISNTSDALGIKVVQCLGKAAHNLVALDATVVSHMHGGGLQIASALESFDQLALAISDDIVPDVEVIRATEVDRNEVFLTLQSLQDEGNLELFRDVLGFEVLTASNQFAASAEQYGWPQPGRSTGYVEPLSFR